MPRLFLVGDLHGDLRAAQDMVDQAAELGCQEIVQLGDWGFVWPGEEDKLQYLSDYLRAAGLRMRFLDGNHDVHPYLFKLSRDSDRTDFSPDKDNCAPFVIYQHRGSLHTYEDGTRVVFLGGAPSIDYRGRTPGMSWWKEEQITHADVNAACAHAATGKIDLLLTHDSATPPPGIKETSDMTFNYRAADSQAKLQWVIDTLKPTVHVHGHYHLRYSGKYKSTQVEGLDCNLGKYLDLNYVYESKP